ncbi:rhodanese-like domain-containing protein [Clostridium hydrogeniformans]|uniref:rhodanese-like domain-containing protein n=1 Tax=Clostridium hydrogeniformans TaxID=349933 RepID=UPI00047FCC7A|nr:rhodanese-like domain-containing protein [Clostridium hydrogeniformans]
MKKFLGLIMSLLLVTSVVLVGCSSKEKKEEGKGFQYYTADQVKESIEKKKDMILLDIQVEDEFNKHHIKGAIPTYAYPVKTDEDKKKLDKEIPNLEKSTAPIVIVCPGGAGGAEKTHAYLKEKGIKEDRIYILEKGQKAWPHKDLLETK